MWSSQRIVLALFVVVVTFYLPFLSTVVHEMGHLIVKLLSGVKVSEFSVGSNGGEVLWSFKWNDILFLIKEGYNVIGGYVLYDPRTVPNAFWGMLSAFSGAFLSLNFLVPVLWGWLGVFSYKVGFFHFYFLVYAKFLRWVKYIFYPPAFFKRLKLFIDDPKPKGKRVSLIIFMCQEKIRLFFFIPCLAMFYVGFTNLTNLIPIKFSQGYSDGASLFAYFLSLFDPSAIPYNQSTLDASVMVANIIALLIFLYLVIFWMIAFIKRPNEFR